LRPMSRQGTVMLNTMATIIPDASRTAGLTRDMQADDVNHGSPATAIPPTPPLSSSAGERYLVLQARRPPRNYWSVLWHYRELFAILAWRDIAVRYKQTMIGVAWAIVRPLLTVLICTIVFSRLAGLPSDGIAPYPVLVFAGMLPWFLFSSIL